MNGIVVQTNGNSGVVEAGRLNEFGYINQPGFNVGDAVVFDLTADEGFVGAKNLKLFVPLPVLFKPGHIFKHPNSGDGI